LREVNTGFAVENNTGFEVGFAEIGFDVGGILCLILGFELGFKLGFELGFKVGIKTVAALMKLSPHHILAINMTKIIFEMNIILNS